MPDASPELVAAVLLHDAPYFAPEHVDLDATLTAYIGAPVARVVRALEREHATLAEQATPRADVDDLSTLHASAADKIVSLTSILRHADRADDPTTYWSTRAAFVARVPYFRAFHTAAATHLSASMSTQLGRLVARAERATTGGQ